MGALLSAMMPSSGGLPDDVRSLLKHLKRYLRRDELHKIRRAYEVGAAAHAGQTRKSGEPYITHPVAVAHILADIGLDGEAIVAAILHDTLEDTPLSREAIESEFGHDVVELVDGVTKLDKVNFRDRQEATAESFRKMVMAMARDLRVILIKLADRLHNMRTLGSMAPASRRRIARETLEIYAPIAQRLGMNRFKAELQDLGFAALYPMRHRVIAEHIRQLQGNRKQAIERIQESISRRLKQEGIRHRVVSRVKSPYSIYQKMLKDRKPLSQVMDVYGVRVITDTPMHCYHALGAVHGLYKPVDGRFRDFVAIPKANGYQSLHTVLIGPFDAPIEVQVRTEDMNVVAERGVAAHWSYKTNGTGSNAQNRARDWLAGLVEAQARTGSSAEFVENVKVDLFPDEVYVFTPRGDILPLPRGATVLDFAYAVHTSVGDHAVTARVDKKLSALRSKLDNGQTVEIVTAPSAQPHPGWLEFVATSRARTAIRNHLKRLQHEDAVELGHRMLDRALAARGGSIELIPAARLEQYLGELRFKRLEDLLSDIALGNRVAEQVAAQLLSSENIDADSPVAHPVAVGERILITGRERGVISFGQCCHPIPGDDIMGYLSAGKGVVVHQVVCRNMPEYRKAPERLVAIAWDRKVEGDFRVQLRIVVMNKPGVLAGVAAAIAAAESNIAHVEYTERDLEAAVLLFTIEVRDRRHLASVIRSVRHTEVVHSVQRAIG
jgi:guanosine-3',5'-bis(diphosphate) 3'-pyrophosphohydrolase